jgi:hypothetical protein
MSKEQIIKDIEGIDEQLKKNRATIDAYSGQEGPIGAAVSMLCDLSIKLIATREMLQDMLLKNYGVYYMRGAN